MPAARKPSIRRDPAPRRVDLSRDDGSIVGADPEKAYVWAYKAGDAIGMYENRGYEVETIRADGSGPRSRVARTKGLTPGQPVEWKSNVLMSISKAELAEIEAQGQAETDELESRILSKGGGVDSLRGINGIRGRDGTPVLGLENKTGGTQVELE